MESVTKNVKYSENGETTGAFKEEINGLAGREESEALASVANEGLSHLAFFSPFCFPAHISPAVLNQGRPENKPPAAVCFILPRLKAVTDTRAGNKVHRFTDDQRLSRLCADNKKPFDDKTASPG